MFLILVEKSYGNISSKRILENCIVPRYISLVSFNFSNKISSDEWDINDDSKDDIESVLSENN